MNKINEQHIDNVLDHYFGGVKGKKTAKIVSPSDAVKKRNHDESNLQLAFCKWVKFQYPKVDFIRHEREQKRSKFSGQLMGKYNSLGGIPDWECLDGIGQYKGLYIEFKRPGESWLNKHGEVKPAYAHQYHCHQKLWAKGRCSYFSNNLDEAMMLMDNYMNGTPHAQQLYPYTPEDKKKYLVDEL